MKAPDTVSSLLQTLNYRPFSRTASSPAAATVSEKPDHPSPVPPSALPPTTMPEAAAATPPAWPQKRTLRVLCFGDSLTAGWCPARAGAGAVSTNPFRKSTSPPSPPAGPSYRPYAEAFGARLQRAFPNLRIETTLDGLPGDCVVSTASRESKFRARMESHFAAPPAAASRDHQGGLRKSPFDWTVVLGGTNDLAAVTAAHGGPTVEQVFDALKGVWDVALSRGGKVLAVTVPEGAPPVAAGRGGRGAASAERERERVKSRRAKLNGLIKGHQAKNFHVFDLNAALPYSTLSDAERRVYWSDDPAAARHHLLHPTAAGYDLMGERIAATLINVTMPPGRLQQAGKDGDDDGAKRAKRRRMFRDDAEAFVEEDGDDGTLEHGYIVVRKKDLD